MFQRFGFAESLLSERQVFRDVHDHGVCDFASFSVESLRAGRADAGVEAWDDVQNDLLASEISQGLFAEISVDECEIRSRTADSR